MQAPGCLRIDASVKTDPPWHLGRTFFQCERAVKGGGALFRI